MARIESTKFRVLTVEGDFGIQLGDRLRRGVVGVFEASSNSLLSQIVRLGELYRICMLLVIFVACIGFCVVNYVLKMREIGGCGFWILMHWNWP